MRTLRLLDPAALGAGVFVGTRLDPLAGTLAAQGTPGLVADVDPASGVTSFPNAVGALSGTWGQTTSTPLFPIPVGGSAGPVTTTADGSAWTLTTTAYAVDIAYAQTSKGAIGHVTVDGQARLSFDSSNPQTAVCRVYLDGQSHVVRVTYAGDAVTGTTLVASPTDSAGTPGLAAALTAVRTGGTVIGDIYTVAATGVAAVQVKNGAGAVLGTLGTGQTSDTLVPGVSLTLSAGAWDATSQANLVVSPPTLTLTGITTYANLATAARYTTPVFDSGVANTQWAFVELLQGPLATTPPTLTFGTGDTPTPDATWTWATLAPLAVPDVLGNPWQRVIYAGPATRGRYGQAVGTLSNQTRVVISDARLSWWQPETDPFLSRLPRAIYRGPVALAVLTALAALEAHLDEQADELLTGGAISSAAGKYLAAFGAELATPRLLGEPDANYRARLAVLVGGRNQGGSQPFLQTVLSGALGCPVRVSPRARTGTAFALGAKALGTTGLGKSLIGNWRWTVQVPVAQLRVPVETATAIVDQLRPLGSLVSIQYV